MTVMRMGNGLGPDIERVKRHIELVNNGVPADEMPEVTVEDIHAYIITYEEQMDADIAKIADIFKRKIFHHGFNVDFDAELRNLNLTNATWNRAWVSSTYDQIVFRELPNDRKTMTAQITSKDIYTWIGSCNDPLAYLGMHLAHQGAHNAEIARVGARAAEIATDRQWCSEYDDIVETLRSDLAESIVTNIDKFGERERIFELMVTVVTHIPVQVTARMRDVADGLAVDSITESLMMNSYRNGNYEVTGVEPL